MLSSLSRLLSIFLSCPRLSTYPPTLSIQEAKVRVGEESILDEGKANEVGFHPPPSLFLLRRFFHVVSVFLV